MTQAQLQFHWMRLGNRSDVAKLFGITLETIAARLPVTDTQRFMRGQQVPIGPYLVKRCMGCGTARMLEEFYADNARASGCRAYCESCREDGRGR